MSVVRFIDVVAIPVAGCQTGTVRALRLRGKQRTKHRDRLPNRGRLDVSLSRRSPCNQPQCFEDAAGKRPADFRSVSCREHDRFVEQ